MVFVDEISTHLQVLNKNLNLTFVFRSVQSRDKYFKDLTNLGLWRPQITLQEILLVALIVTEILNSE